MGQNFERCTIGQRFPQNTNFGKDGNDIFFVEEYIFKSYKNPIIPGYFLRNKFLFTIEVDDLRNVNVRDLYKHHILCIHESIRYFYNY